MRLLQPILCFLFILSCATDVAHRSKSLEGAETMSVSKFDDIMRSLTSKYKELEIAYNNAAVEDKTMFGILLNGVRTLTATGSSIASNPIIATAATLLYNFVGYSNTALKIIGFSKTVYNYLAGTTDDSQVDADIKSLKKDNVEIRSQLNYLGNRVVKELNSIKSILYEENTRQKSRMFKMLMDEFNDHVHMISVDIKRCQAQLSSTETKVNERLSLRWILVIMGLVALGVAAALTTKSTPAIVGVVGLTVICIACCVVANAEDARRISELEEIKIELVSYLDKTKCHVEKFIADGIPAGIMELFEDVVH